MPQGPLSDTRFYVNGLGATVGDALGHYLSERGAEISELARPPEDMTTSPGKYCAIASGEGYLNGFGPLEWGNWERMIALTEDIAYWRGVGNALAEGPARFCANLGHPEVSNTVKGQGIPAYDPRGLKGMGIAYATSNRGACHLRAYTPAAELNIMPFQSLSVDPLEWDGKGKLVKVFQDIHAFSDSLDLCKFSAFAQGIDEYTQQYAAFVR